MNQSSFRRWYQFLLRKLANRVSSRARDPSCECSHHLIFPTHTDVSPLPLIHTTYDLPSLSLSSLILVPFFYTTPLVL